ncbi:MAG: ABC-type transport auxiliary lipoprotein family protein [Pseudomonadota bacterium]
MSFWSLSVSRLRFFLGLLPVSTLGCSGVLTSDAPALREYWVKPPSYLVEEARALGPAIVEIDVSAPEGLNRKSLLKLEPDAQLRPYAGAVWTTRAPQMIEDFVETVFEEAQVPGVDHGNPDARISMKLREFYVDASVQSKSVLQITAVGQCNGETWQQSYRYERLIEIETLQAIVQAHTRNIESLVSEFLESYQGECAISS